MKHFARMWTGILTAVLVLVIPSLISEPIGQVIWIALFCSIVLTAGLVLIIYIPLLYVIGWAILAFIGLFFPTKEKPVESEEIKPSNNVLALVSYIKKHDRPLQYRDIITEDLVKAGWKRKTIDSAFLFIKE